jgi:thermostable 8-oxoguanine DNA glycosylase
MRDVMLIPNVPKATPGSYKEYQHLESLFVNHCGQLGRSVADVDLDIWTQYSRSGAMSD